MIATIEIKNQLNNSKKKIQVFNSITGIKDIIAASDSIVLPILEGGDCEGEYVEIRIIGGMDSNPTEYSIKFPSWLNFQILSQHRIESTFEIIEEITHLVIPDGMHNWKLRVSKPMGVNNISNAIIYLLEGEINNE